MQTPIRFNRVAMSAILIVAVSSSFVAAEGTAVSADQENELLRVLRSDAPPAEKAMTCKLLAIYGSSNAVPDLAKLLPDPELSSWARIALEAIPGSASDEALLEATETVQGRLLVGTINSIGVRRDANTVGRLTSLMQNDDAEVASAAAVALGKIGNTEAADALRQALSTAPADVRSAVAEGCVRCAEQYLAAGNADDAVAIYDEVRQADVSKQRIIEATRGAILARGEDGVPLLVEQLHAPDKAMFQLALGTAREFPGDTVDGALADELVRLDPDRAALLIHAMADRPQSVVLAAVLKAAKQGPNQVRLAAIQAVGRVGDVTCLAPLLDIALDADDELVENAKTSLADLPSDDLDAKIVERLANANGPIYPVLIELVGRRRIDAAPLLLDALNHSDPTVRTAALIALGETADAENLSVLISQVVAPVHSDDAAAAVAGLRAASIRMPDRDACAAKLAVALDQTDDVAVQGSLLEILGAMGGAKALDTLRLIASNGSPQLQDVSSRLLGEWMTADAAPVLLDLAQSVPDEKYQVRALRGYIRIARQFVLPEDERMEMCQLALAAAQRPAEQKLVLDVLKRYPSVASLKLAIAAVQVPELKDDATETAQFIAQRLKRRRTEIDVDGLLSEAGIAGEQS